MTAAPTATAPDTRAPDLGTPPAGGADAVGTVPAGPGPTAADPSASGTTASHPAAAAPTAADRTAVHDLPLLEGYRGVAALLVVMTHVGFASGAALNGGWAGPLARMDFGVAVFFLLSGFLLMRPWVRSAYLGTPAPRTRAYLWRRAVRLLPAYAAVLVGTALLVPAARASGTRAWVDAVLLIHIYRGDPQLPGLSQTWSLATEVSFYLALPVLAAFALRRGRPGRLRPLATLATLAVAAVAFRIWVTVGDPVSPAQTWLPAHLDWFAAGMTMALVSLAPPFASVRASLARTAATPGAWFATGAAVFWLVTTSLGGPLGLAPGSTVQMVTKHVAYLVAATVLLVPAVFDTRPIVGGWRVIALSRPVQWLGRVSYGLFLWHLPVLEAVRDLAGHQDFTGGFWWLLAATLAGGLLLADLSYRLIESPAQRLRRLVR